MRTHTKHIHTTTHPFANVVSDKKTMSISLTKRVHISHTHTHTHTHTQTHTLTHTLTLKHPAENLVGVCRRNHTHMHTHTLTHTHTNTHTHTHTHLSENLVGDKRTMSMSLVGVARPMACDPMRCAFMSPTSFCACVYIFVCICIYIVDL